MLASSGGFARCGHCHQVFDARSNLLDPHAGTHDVSEETAQATPSPETNGDNGEAHPRDPYRDPYRDHTHGADDEAVPAAAEAQSSAQGAGGFAEPPISAEVPPLAAPVFAPEGQSSLAADEPEPELESQPESEPESRREYEASSDEHGEPPFAEDSSALISASESRHIDPTLTESTEPAGDEPAPSSREADWSSHWHDDEPRLNGSVRSEAESEPHLSARLQAQEEAEAEPHLGAESDEPRMRAASVPPPLFPQPTAADGHQRHFTVTREARARSSGRAFGYLIGGVVALVLIVTLIAQLAWWRREAVMVYWPDSQALFVRACARLGCQILPPRDIDGLQVEASDLRQVDGPHRLELRVPLRNRYGIALAYPAIELTLFDSSNDVAIRRILWPQDYLPPGAAAAAGLPAHTTQTMIVRLDSGNAIATNFRVQIFYP
jgi:hypothetical protein